MQVHLLLTPDILEAKPESVEITNEWGDLTVIFDDFLKYGLHCFVEGTQKDIINWLHEFDGVAVGNGSPMTETFNIMHIDDKAFNEINK